MIAAALLAGSLAQPVYRADAQTAAGKEYALKAAFIYNFTRYMQWDGSSGGEDFLIGILGDSDIRKPLDDIAAKRKVGDRAIKVLRFETEEDITPCQILFIPAAQSDKLESILERFKSLKTLTIAEDEGMAKKGAAVNFVEVGGKIRFEMNTDALEKTGITASSKLKNIAILVNGS